MLVKGIKGYLIRCRAVIEDRIDEVLRSLKRKADIEADNKHDRTGMDELTSQESPEIANVSRPIRV